MSDYRKIKVNNEKLEQMGYGDCFFIVINNHIMMSLYFNDVESISGDWDIYFERHTLMKNITDEHMKFVICATTKEFKSLEDMFIHLEEVGCIEYEL